MSPPRSSPLKGSEEIQTSIPGTDMALCTEPFPLKTSVQCGPWAFSALSTWMIVLSGKANRRPDVSYSHGGRMCGVRGVIVTMGTMCGRAGQPFAKQGIKRASPRLRIVCDAADVL